MSAVILQVTFFLLIMFVINIVMLNILISFTGEGFSLAQFMRAELGKRQMLSTINNLEAIILSVCILITNVISLLLISRQPFSHFAFVVLCAPPIMIRHTAQYFTEGKT